MSIRVPFSWPRRVAVVSCTVALIAITACGSDGGSSEGQGTDGDAPPPDYVTTLHLGVASTDQDVMQAATQVVQRRLDALGVERSDIGWDGSTIEVLVPDGDEELLRQALAPTGALEFRPVLMMLGQSHTGDERVAAQDRVDQLRAQLEVPEGVTSADVVADEQAKETAAARSSGGDQGGGEAATPALNQWGVDVYVPEFAELFELEGELSAQITPTADMTPDAEVTLAGDDGNVYVLGPVAVDRTAVQSATANKAMSGQWTVNPVFTPGADSIDAFNAVTAECYEGDVTCPRTAAEHGQLAIVLDGVVLSAPSINTPTFDRDQISISGNFDEQSATALAAALDAGVAPVAWTLRD